jgi:hypothetical protein
VNLSPPAIEYVNGSSVGRPSIKKTLGLGDEMKAELPFPVFRVSPDHTVLLG